MEKKVYVHIQWCVLPFDGISIKHPRTLKQPRTTPNVEFREGQEIIYLARLGNLYARPYSPSCHRLASTVVKTSGEPYHFTKNKRLPITRRSDQHEQDWEGPQPMSSSMSEVRVAVPFFCLCQKFSQPANKRVDLFVPGTFSRCPCVYTGGGRSKEDEHTVPHGEQ